MHHFDAHLLGGTSRRVRDGHDPPSASFDFSRPPEIERKSSCVLRAFLRHRWRRLSAVAAGNGELLDTTAVVGGWVTGVGGHSYVPGAAANPRWWKFDLGAPSLVGTPIGCDLGRAWVGRGFRPTRNFSDATNITLRYGSDASSFSLVRKDSGAIMPATGGCSWARGHDTPSLILGA
jgi:hypothetical protein